MSKFVTYNCRELKNQEILLAALATLGYSDGKVEVHSEAQPLYGFQGDRRPEQAHIIIRRNNTGLDLSNDIGFLRTADGTFAPIVSEYDAGALRAGRERTPFVEAVTNAYGRITADRAVSSLLKTTIPRMKAQGLIPHHATVQRIPSGQTTRVVIRYQQ